jgi:ankyrin repeat protein
VGCGKPPPPDISIHKAAGAGNIEAVKQHLAAGTDVNAKEEDGSTPLHQAAWEGHKEIAELLITKGADVSAKDEDGWTPLHYAADYGHKEIVELLIAKGADVNAKNGSGETPLDWAKVEIAELLRKHGGKRGEKLEVEGKPTDPVAEAAKPEPPTAKTPLWKAAMFGEIEPAKQAIADGADVNAKGERGLTPLHFAVFAALDSGDNKVIELLIANGADVNAKDDSGLTPLDSVKRLSEAAAITKKLRAIQGKTDDIPVADLLRKHGGKTGAELKAEGK